MLHIDATIAHISNSELSINTQSTDRLHIKNQLRSVVAISIYLLDET